MPTQLDQIRQHLKEHGHITSWDAIQAYRMTRLSEYIRQLREEGWQITSEWEHNETRRWVKYVLVAILEKNGQQILV